MFLHGRISIREYNGDDGAPCRRTSANLRARHLSRQIISAA
ncbi:hypothetical protein SS05631_c33070 [Sinorhizobium sp. CCBAU 05631]|nr:hypothetical protein SS05631_c33070 [Sinorhizobium sp. CCBAU 05631]